jgi:hypothetical protein
VTCRAMEARHAIIEEFDMTIRIVKRGASKDKPVFCPMLIDYPYDVPESK